MKKLNFTPFLMVLVIVLFTQCQPREKGSQARLITVNGSEVIDCNISEVTDTIDLPLSEIITECEVIPLETNEKSLFESVYHIGISKNYIAIHSRGQYPIKLFNREGKFIRDIGKIGRGPGEFNSLYGIQLDEAASKVYLTPFANARELIVYSLDNENLPPIPLTYKQSKCQTFVENNTVTVLSMPFEGSGIPVAYQQDLAGKVIQEVQPMPHQILRPDFSSEVSSTRNAGANDIFILAYGSKTPDTLYYYNTKTNRLDPKFVATFSGENQGTWLYDWKSYYRTWVFGKYNGKKVLVDKKTLKSDFFRIKNDFYGGIELYKFFMSNNGWFVASMPAHELKTKFTELLENGDLKTTEKEKIKGITAQLDENDNEVLFVGKMK
ncbi:6-bladed beta-propeller [Draconibacterium halophilum]|uniref:6-bladed beta-propeller n=1 Tax=Draconibacterium halophilum TaxID=2706887 RepID=A0A6C0RBK2_9BACT|nr:6-bladed beta-propeller [Draconibacterium halophilum]QIA06551.1 6-bladed beta-propeller [Draconibacterium halophilum]